MTRSPLALAALATVAVPGLDAVDVRRPRHPTTGTDSAIVIDAEGRRWVVRAPQGPATGAALEAEVGLLGGLAAHVDAGLLPFDVPRPTGFAELPEGGRAVVHPQLPGRPLRLEDLGPGPGLAAEVGRAIAAIHELPPETIEDAGLPVYEADAYRRRRLTEVDEAARTGRVPTGLLRRWEHALEDVSLWRFRPVVVHGDLSADHVLCSGERPVAVLGWSEAKVADPADDLAWLLVAAPHEGVDAILEAYNMRRTELRDPHLADRALLAGELALARWLLHGVRLEDGAIVEDATAMLAELAAHTDVADDVVAIAPFELAAEGGEGQAAGGEVVADDAAVADDADAVAVADEEAAMTADPVVDVVPADQSADEVISADESVADGFVVDGYVADAPDVDEVPDEVPAVSDEPDVPAVVEDAGEPADVPAEVAAEVAAEVPVAEQPALSLWDRVADVDPAPDAHPDADAGAHEGEGEGQGESEGEQVPSA